MEYDISAVDAVAQDAAATDGDVGDDVVPGSKDMRPRVRLLTPAFTVVALMQVSKLV